MRKYILTGLFFAIAVSGYSQKQTNIWYFGKKAGLDFNQSPPLVLKDGSTSAPEGTSIMSDNNGRLLFYCDGIRVFNRKHELMPSGNGLFGSPSSTDNSVIVPMPGNANKYYIFVIGSSFDDDPIFSYSIIDMTADAGFGDVVVKNNLISDSALEKLAVVRHCNKRDFWVVVHKWGTDKYLSYAVTPAGFNAAPVVSSTGLVIDGIFNNEIGTLKFSSKGDKLVSVHSFQKDAVELMDFDNTTGVITNPLVFVPNQIPRDPSFTGVYGAEFSPDGKLLYVSSNNSAVEPCILYQFDITSGNVSTISASRKVIANTSPWYAGDLQLAVDNKIYMAMWNNNALSVIENPNISGSGCNFSFNKIVMERPPSEPVQFGLPTLLQSYFDSSSNPYDFSREGNCADKSVQFKINRLGGIDSVKWDFNDGQTSTVLQPLHTFSNNGFYDVNLIVYKVDCSGLNDTITRSIWIAGSSTFLGSDTTSCTKPSANIGVDEVNGVNYLWNTGFNGNKIDVTEFGTYWLEMEQNGCKVRDSISYYKQTPPVVNLGRDTSVCNYKQIVLTAGNNIMLDYLWSTGETTSSITINKKGTYYVTVSEGACVASDTVVVIPGDCDIYVPTAFTPNGDNLNETFGVSTDVTVRYFAMQIFSKWGQVIFNTNDVSRKWDGKFQGKEMANGAYFWTITYINQRGIKVYDQGMVILIR